MSGNVRAAFDRSARHNEVTAGVLRGIIADLKCLPKGWL